MTSKMKVAFDWIITTGMLFVLSGWFVYNFIESNKLFEKIYLGLISLIFVLITIYDLLKPVKNCFIFKQIYSVFELGFDLIFTLTVGLKIILDPFAVFMIMFSVHFILFRLVFLILGFNIGPEVTYVFLVIAIILFAYKGVYLTHLFQRRFSKNKGELRTRINELTVKMVSVINFRRRIYEIMILMYILSFIEKTSVNFNIKNIYWTNYSEISLEILLTFVVIDGYVNTFMPEVIEKERKQYRELKQYYSLHQECE